MEQTKSSKTSDGDKTPILELSIYDPMPRPQPVYAPRQRTELEEQIAVVRRFFVKVMKRSSVVYSTAVAHSSESVHRVLDGAEMLRMERGFLPRLTAVGLSGVAGFVFAGRGAGKLQRMFYMLTFASAATVVSWPQQTKASVVSAYRFAQQLSNGSRNRQSLDITASVAMPEESALVVKAVEETAVRQGETEKVNNKTRSGSKDAPPQNGDKPVSQQNTDIDHGQSNPADKDLYSTRG